MNLDALYVKHAGHQFKESLQAADKTVAKCEEPEPTTALVVVTWPSVSAYQPVSALSQIIPDTSGTPLAFDRQRKFVFWMHLDALVRGRPWLQPSYAIFFSPRGPSRTCLNHFDSCDFVEAQPAPKRKRGKPLRVAGQQFDLADWISRERAGIYERVHEDDDLQWRCIPCNKVTIFNSMLWYAVIPYSLAVSCPIHLTSPHTLAS